MLKIALPGLKSLEAAVRPGVGTWLSGQPFSGIQW